MTTDPIQQFILRSEENLCIAAKVIEAWPEVRAQIVADFLDRLGTRLKRELKSWRFATDVKFFDARWGCYLCWKPAWSDEYAVGLQAFDWGNRMAIGVFRHYDRIGKQRPFSNELFDAVKKKRPTARRDPWWEATAFIKSPATDWRKADVLWQMKKEGKFLDEVTEDLLEVAEISEPFIDRLVRKYKK